MKLFTRYSRINITATICVFVLGSIAFYFVLQYVLLRQLNETLRSEQQEISGYISLHDTLPEFENTRHQWVTLQPTQLTSYQRSVRSVLSFNPDEHEDEWIRELTFLATAGRRNYLVTVHKSEAETDDLLKLIIGVTMGMIAVILLVNFIINRRLVGRLLKPFYQTIDAIRNYQLASRAPLGLPGQRIDELNLLNESFNQMAQRIQSDYHELKTFTENASHEMQTPLSVIRAKAESLAQSSANSEHQMKEIGDIEDATNKLSRLHQSLLLLTKINNHQFHTNERSDLSGILRKKIREWEDLPGVSISTDIADNVSPFMHPHLAEILVSNLLNNAIRHTPAGGTICVSLSGKSLVVSNTAAGDALDADRVFGRFYKKEAGSEGTGLGLAIVKDVCQVSGCGALYSFRDHTHIFTIIFTGEV